MTKSLRLIKPICIALAVVLLCSPVSALCAGASNAAAKEYDNLPVVFVSGFGATTLALQGEDGTKTAVFPPSGDGIKQAFNGKVGDIVLGLVKGIFMNNFDLLADSLGEVVSRILEPVSLNADGTSKHNIVPIVSGAENTSLKAFTDNDMLSFVPYTGSEFLDMESVGDIVGDDKVFNFIYDWRMSHADTAELFRTYLQDVMRLTGSDKVNVYSISQGSLIIGAYMYKHADDGYLNNVVFDTPVLSGTDLVPDIVTKDKISLNYGFIGSLLSEILHTEFDLSAITNILPAGFLNDACEFGRLEIVLPAVKYGIAFWDMIPNDKVADLADYWLDPVESARVIKKTAEMHDGFMSHITQTLKKAEANGAKVSIKTCTGSPLASGTIDNTDGIVNVKYSCGASCAPFGEKFAENYTQKKDGALSVSPDRTVDLSCGYYPEKTWTIAKLYHGQAEWDPRSLDFIVTQLMTPGVKDAYSSYEFPQFMESHTPNDDLCIDFTSTNCCFLPYSQSGFAGNTMTLRNLSLKDKMIIKSITLEKGSIALNVKLPKLIKPGKSISIPFTGTVPTADIYDTITIKYVDVSNPFKTLALTFGITLTDNYAGVIK